MPFAPALLLVFFENPHLPFNDVISREVAIDEDVTSAAKRTEYAEWLRANGCRARAEQVADEANHINRGGKADRRTLVFYSEEMGRDEVGDHGEKFTFKIGPGL